MDERRSLYQEIFEIESGSSESGLIADTTTGRPRRCRPNLLCRTHGS